MSQPSINYPTSGTLDAVFDPPEEAWTPLDPRYCPLKRLMVLFTYLPMLIIAVAVAILTVPTVIPGIALAVLGLAFVSFRWRRQDALARAWGYAERESDLFVRHGLWFRYLSVVPYGRMQAVEVSSGPIERRYGLATVQLVTASSGTDARIPGLAAEAAAQLRDRLSERGENQAAGI